MSRRWLIALILIVLFVAGILVGAYRVRIGKLRLQFDTAMSKHDEAGALRAMRAWPRPVSRHDRELWLIEAVNWCSTDFAVQLMEDGVDVSKGDGAGYTALNMVAGTGNIPMAECLIAHGADVNAGRIDRGDFLSRWTPLHYCAGAIIHYWTGSNYEDKGGTPAMVEFLVRNGAVVDSRDAEGRTPLHIAAMRSNVGVMFALIDAGADIEARTRRQETPLWIASEQLKPDAVRVLLESGADVCAKDISGWTPLQEARGICGGEEFARGRGKVIELLLQYGAK
jgi:ankyrin repeat protein